MKGTSFFAFAFVIMTALVVIRAIEPASLVTAREAYFDQLQRWQPRATEDLPIRVVDIDEASLAKLGQWPWPRHIMASLVERLSELGAAVVVFDFLFAEPDRLSAAQLLDDPLVARTVRGAGWLANLDELDYDRIFSESMARMPVALGVSDAGTQGGAPMAPKAGFVQVGDVSGAIIDLRTSTGIVPVLYEGASGVGVINVSPTTDDGIIREVPLVWKTGDQFTPSLALEALRLAVGESTVILLPDETGTALASVRVGEFEARTDENGLFRVRYRPDNAETYVPAWQVLDPSQDMQTVDRLAGHIILVGTSAAGLLDIRTTALGERVPGVSIHAQIIEQILLQDFLVRTTLSDLIDIGLFVLLALLLTSAMVLFGPGQAMIVGGAASIAALATSIWLFADRGLLIDATFPLIGGFLTFSLLVAFRYIVADREKRLIRSSFSKYVAPSVLRQIEERGHDLKLGGDMRDVTVMFSDIRDFTPLSESMSAEDLVHLLNALFTDLTEEIHRTRGTVDKYIGDSIMAFWNAPISLEAHHDLACRSALAMRRRLAEFDGHTSGGDAHTPIRMATGLASGRACVGNMGSQNRFNYSVIGDVVNQAARIEAACRRLNYDIAASEEVIADTTSIAALPAGYLDLKGIQDRVMVYAVVGDETVLNTDAFKALAEAHRHLMNSFQQGHAEQQSALAECRRLSMAVEPQLVGFYDAAEGRRSDFAARGPQFVTLRAKG